MAAARIEGKNRIANLLETQGMSKYRLHKNMNEQRPFGVKPISYKTVLSLVNCEAVAFATHYGNMLLIAKVLNVSVGDLQTT